MMLWLSTLALLTPCGLCAYGIFRRFVTVHPQRWRHVLLVLTMSGTIGMVIWVGDNNLLMTMPVFFFLCLVCTCGVRVARVAVTAVFFCLIMSFSALIDTYTFSFGLFDYTTLVHLLRLLCWLALWLALRRFLPRQAVTLENRLWYLILALTAAPFFALTATVVVSSRYESETALQQSMTQSAIILPFVALSALALLAAITVLSRHTALAQAHRLAEMREAYFQSLRREQEQVRRLRHDMANHLTALSGLLAQGDGDRAAAYLQALRDAPAMQTAPRLCENETVSIVLAAKVRAAAQAGLTTDCHVALPPLLPVPDADLCALFGNALDNAIEATQDAADKRITVRARADKGLLMLRVTNAYNGTRTADETGAFPTTKSDRHAHGLGLSGMREIAARCGGTLEVTAADGVFELIACIPL